MRQKLFYLGICLGFCTIVPTSTHAQEKSSAESILVPPKVKTRVEPVYPPERLKKGERANVVVELTITKEGKVTATKIAESAGADFDQAALEAAQQLEFEPATRNGQPILSKIKYKFNFDFKDVPTQPTTTPTSSENAPVVQAPKPTGALVGELKTPIEQPLAGATITIKNANGKIINASSDAKGNFSLNKLPPGRYLIRVTADGFTAFEATEDIAENIETRVKYRLALASEGIVITVEGQRPPREVTKRVLEQRELLRIPGTNGDALRSIQSLPGVARPPGLTGLLIIRGSAPQDTNVFFDGTLTPIVYHFGGLSSVVPSELIERIDFFPGNFSTEYGRVMGGIVDVGIRSPRKDRIGGLLQFDLIDGRLLVEGPIDDKTRFAVGTRRSWIDVWLSPVLRAAGTGVSTAPVYYDYQAMVERDFSSTTTGRLLFFGSDDRLAVTLGSPSSSDPSIGGDLSTRTGFWRIQARTDTKFSKNIRWLNTLAFGYDYIDFNLGSFFFNLTNRPLTYRSDLRVKLSKEVAFIAGLDWLWSTFDVSLRTPPLPQPGEATGPFFARPSPTIATQGSLYRPALYTMFDVTPARGLRILPGARLDYTKDTNQWHLSPRLTARYDIRSKFPRSTLKWGLGLFMQPPQPQESYAPFGTPGVQSNRAIHYSAGFEQEFTKQLEVSVDFFYKDLKNLVVRTPSLTAISGLEFKNQGSGRVYGSEILLRYKPDSHFFGWLAYTLSRSERRDSPTSPIRLFEYDQTHILTVLGSYRLGRGWEVGLRWRLISGNVYTPNIGGVADFDAGAYTPIPAFPSFGGRFPPYHQLDLRVDKQWKFNAWRLAIYLDVQNVYNRQNPVNVTYNYNYSQSSFGSGIPIIPSLGIRGEI